MDFEDELIEHQESRDILLDEIQDLHKVISSLEAKVRYRDSVIEKLRNVLEDIRNTPGCYIAQSKALEGLKHSS